MAQCLFGEDRNTVLLFDEMDDLLSHGHPIFHVQLGSHSQHFGNSSKVFSNRLLEESRAPILWTTNETYRMNSAILRRVTYAVEMRQPPPRIRARIWERQLARHSIEATPDDAFGLAREFDASPGVAAAATKAADLCTGDIATVRRSVRSLARLLGRDGPPFKVTGRFDASLFTADMDLAALRVLTPDDFAVVRRKAELLGQLRDAANLMSMLHAECDAKPDHQSTIGFGCP